MKRLFFVALLLIAATAGRAHDIQPGAAICPQCGVELRGEEMKHFDDPDYHRSGCTWVKRSDSGNESESSSSSYSSSSSSSSSTHLRDYKPLPEVKSRLNISSGKSHCMYHAGDGEHMITCPACGNVAHERWCVFAMLQKMAIDAKAKAMAATTPEDRRKAIIDFHVCEDNLLSSFDYNLAKFTREREEAERQAQASAQLSSAPGSYQHLSSADIKNGYDKKLSFGSDFATAYCATAPNGTERWALFDIDGVEVGQFSKVEFVEANGINQYILVRDDNGKWGIYGRGGTRLCEPKFESVKMLSSVVNDIGGIMVVFDVTMRNNGGVLQHGIYNPDIEEMNHGFNENKNPMTIPCEYDYVELIDRSATYDGVLAKVRKNGLSGVIGTFNGTEKIPVAYSYINTYFTLKGGMYLLVGDGNRMGAYHVDDGEFEEVVPITSGYSLDKVRSLIDSRDR